MKNISVADTLVTAKSIWIIHVGRVLISAVIFLSTCSWERKWEILVTHSNGKYNHIGGWLLHKTKLSQFVTACKQTILNTYNPKLRRFEMIAITNFGYGVRNKETHQYCNIEQLITNFL